MDSSGKVALSNLVSAWAEAEGLTKENILDTVQACTSAFFSLGLIGFVRRTLFKL